MLLYVINFITFNDKEHFSFFLYSFQRVQFLSIFVWTYGGHLYQTTNSTILVFNTLHNLKQHSITFVFVFLYFDNLSTSVYSLAVLYVIFITICCLIYFMFLDTSNPWSVSYIFSKKEKIKSANQIMLYSQSKPEKTSAFYNFKFCTFIQGDVYFRLLLATLTHLKSAQTTAVRHLSLLPNTFNIEMFISILSLF